MKNQTPIIPNSNPNLVVLSILPGPASEDEVGPEINKLPVLGWRVWEGQEDGVAWVALPIVPDNHYDCWCVHDRATGRCWLPGVWAMETLAEALEHLKLAAGRT